MARVKGGLNAKKRHNRVLKLAKGLQRRKIPNSTVSQNSL